MSVALALIKHNLL